VRTLAIECATEACSVALFDEELCVANVHEVIGRGHAERLLPAIATLPGKGRADRIVVSLGPGSFTGVRIGLAAARALGLAWSVDVLGYPTMALVAAMARIDHPRQAVTVCMTGGHGEWFVQDFDGEGSAHQPVLSLPPDAARNRTNEYLIAGSKAAECLSGDGQSLDFLPDARHIMHLPFSFLTIDLSPIYGRPPDAKLPHEVQRKGHKGA
jgi:tRNA threonylcarbamoyladenosine biosynthesis protein TsaB